MIHLRGFYGIGRPKFSKKEKTFRQEESLDSFAMLTDAASPMRDDTDHQIHVEQLEIFARVGVPETEREKPQRLTVNITLWPRIQASDLHDDIRKTVNYSIVCEETKTFVQERSDSLIETLADGIATYLLKKFAIEKIIVELRKFVLPDADYVSVTVTRTASLS